MSTLSPRRTHQVPTHIRTPETLLTLAGVALSARQFLLLLIGASVSYELWLSLRLLAPLPAGQVLRVVVSALPLGVALAFAFVTLAARTLDAWCLVWLRYALRPHRLVWRSVRFVDPGLLAGMAESDLEKEDAHDD